MHETPAVISESDRDTIEVWSAGCKSATSQRSYKRVALGFLTLTGKSLIETTSGDIQKFFDDHTQGTMTSRCTALSAVKSLFSFALKTGRMPHNPGASVAIPKARHERTRPVIDHNDIERMIALENDERNFAMLLVAYSGGLLVSELSMIKWCDIAEHENGATLRVIGYRGKVREVRVSAACWKALSILRGHAKPSEPVFVSKKGGHLSLSAVHRVVKAAALRAGLPENLSIYWLRHAQTSHSLDAGIPLRLLQLKLGHSNIDTTKRYVEMFAVS